MKDEVARKGLELILKALQDSNTFAEFKHNYVSAILEILKEMI